MASAAAMAERDETGTEPFTEDRFLDGRLLLRQPRLGHRIGTDALLLAAASPADGRVCDLGAGVGAVGLALGLRGAAAVVLVERDPTFAAMARLNVEAGGFGGRAALAEVDLFDRERVLAEPLLADGSFDAVATNPPYDQSLAGRRSPAALKRAAHAMDGGGLDDWLKAAARLLKEGGALTLIHRADKLGPVLAAMPARLGGVAVRPVLPRAEAAATRILVAATAGSRAPLAILPPFVLHGADGGFTAEARAVHEGRAVIAMKG
jgi:tRNA1(Val) A37 N6-methylase TrmN6